MVQQKIIFEKEIIFKPLAAFLVMQGKVYFLLLLIFFHLPSTYIIKKEKIRLKNCDHDWQWLAIGDWDNSGSGGWVAGNREWRLG